MLAGNLTQRPHEIIIKPNDQFIIIKPKLNGKRCQQIYKYISTATVLSNAFSRNYQGFSNEEAYDTMEEQKRNSHYTEVTSTI